MIAHICSSLCRSFNLPDTPPSPALRPVTLSVAYVTEIHNATVTVVPSLRGKALIPSLSLSHHRRRLQFQAVHSRQRVLLPAGEVLRAGPHSRAAGLGQRRRRARHSRPPLRQARSGAAPGSGASPPQLMDTFHLTRPSLETAHHVGSTFQ